ncbi:MAG: APH(2'')-Ia/If/Ih family aminoglycoside O-phosphotransferase [Clostridia bacterium]|nr:APH(2'')-Ia/If/Ih family aminoglycoside O-phosphotransferase [Clostridia bacterium]
MKIENLIKSKFDLEVANIKIIGEGYDSKAYLINDEYIFKLKISSNKKKGYKKEKAVLDFLNRNLRTTIKIPQIDFIYIDNELSIMGYKKINGAFLTPDIYKEMNVKQQEILKKDIAKFLKDMHNLDYAEIKEYVIDNKQNCFEEYDLLQKTIYNDLTEKEKKYIEKFFERLNNTTIFNDKKCLCHNDFSCNHLLIDNNKKLVGIIDFGDSGIIDEYCDFIYLLEDSEEEIGKDFGEDILQLYGDIDINKAKEYQDIVEMYYPIETIIYGIKNNRDDFIKKGRKILNERC